MPSFVSLKVMRQENEVYSSNHLPTESGIPKAEGHETIETLSYTNTHLGTLARDCGKWMENNRSY